MVPWYLPHVCQILTISTFAASTRLSNTYYHSTFAASTLIILFSRNVENLKFCFLKERKFSMKILNLQEYFICWNFKFQILMNYLTNMSQSCQGLTTVITFEIFISTNKIFLKTQYFPSQFFLRIFFWVKSSSFLKII